MSTRTFALIFGIVFLIVGAGGFIPGLNMMDHSGHAADADVTVRSFFGYELGLFPVNVLHNIVHLLFGIAGIALARTISGARNYLIWGGAVYLVLWLYGMFIDHESPANFVPLNTADNWLHFLLGVGMLALGLLLTRDRVDRGAGTTRA